VRSRQHPLLKPATFRAKAGPSIDRKAREIGAAHSERQRGDTCAVLTVWMADWQMQCCGELFSVGATVEWTLAPVGDRGAIALAMGLELAETVTHQEDHHRLLLPENAPRTAGTVRSIRAIHGRYGRAQGEANCLSQLRESATATLVSSADG
jgi:hypothetical protein